MSLINWYRAITQCTQCCSVKSTALAATCAVYAPISGRSGNFHVKGRSRNRSYAVYAPCYTVTEEATRDCKNVYCGLCCSCTWNLHLFFFEGFRREREFTVAKNNVKLCLGLLRKGLLLVLFSVFFWISLYLLQYYYTVLMLEVGLLKKRNKFKILSLINDCNNWRTENVFLTATFIAWTDMSGMRSMYSVAICYSFPYK